MFFQPYYPASVTEELHEDFWRLTQTILFKKQCDGQIYESLTVLMRVDSQIHDKDLRGKMKVCKDFKPEDFEIAEEFSMTQHAKKRSLTPVNIFDDEKVFTTAEFPQGELKSAINSSGMGPIRERQDSNEGR